MTASQPFQPPHVVFTDEEVQYMLDNIEQFSESELGEISELVDELNRRNYIETVYNDLIAFCQHIMPEYVVGAHHRHLARLLMDVAFGRESRLTVSIAPRHGKSQIVSIFFIAWYLGQFPDHKVMLVSHTTDLAVDFGRKVRNLLGSKAYQEIFPDTQLAPDSKSAGRWNTTAGGEFFAAGVGSSIAGRGAHLLVVDDAHSEQDVLNGNMEVFAKAYEWFTFGARTRLMPGGRVVIVGTRWSKEDLIGRVVQDMGKNEKADQYTVVEFPAMIEKEVEKEDGSKEVITRALWPEFFDMDALTLTKNSMPLFQWNSQFQQNPTSEEGAIVKREWWNLWMKDDPPDCEFIIMTLDAASETHNRADFTAITTWGVFFNTETDAHNIVLLNAIKERYEFHELKAKALEQYKEWEPDSFIVEKKSAGTPLYQELRRMGVPAAEYTPHRGSGDKMARLNSVSDIIKSGLVWVPPARWAEELVDEIAAFPFGSNDDLLDCSVMALMRFRSGGFIRLPSDMQDEPQYWGKKKAVGYAW